MIDQEEFEKLRESMKEEIERMRTRIKSNRHLWRQEMHDK